MDFTQYCGHIKDDELKEMILSKQEFPLAKQACCTLIGTTRPERIIHTDLLVELLGAWPHIVQSTSDCTSFGAANAIHILKAYNCLKNSEDWISTVVSELIYAGSRVEIGLRRWSGSGGASGAATAECCKRMGTLTRGKYLNYDFTTYSGKLADKLGESGIPDDLEPVLKEHCVKTISLITDTNTAIDCLSNYYPITIASTRGFEGRKDSNGRLLRDSDGCLKAGGSWPHQMAALGYSLNSKRPKIAIANSWPENCMTGPLDGLPEGCFWIDMRDFEIILSQQDSFVYSDFIGFKSKPLSWRL